MNLLQNSITNGRFVSIYDTTETNGKFHVCRCLCCDETYMLLQTITTRGFDDGFYLIPIDYIYRIDIDDEYTNRIERLFHLQNQSISENFCFGEGPILIQLFTYAKQNKLVTSFFIENGDDITGRISDIDTETNQIAIDKLTLDGKSDGRAILDVESIEKVICNSGEERCIEMLEGQNSTGDGLREPF